MRVIANMVVRNEADRYLESCLQWLLSHVDEIFVTDDRSEDETVDIAIEGSATIYTRGTDEPSFLEAEGDFRSIGWQRMLETFHPEEGDWILGIDADEFPVARNVKELCADANLRGVGSINVKIPEIFELSPLSERIDGFWGDITGTRLARYREGPQDFRTSKMGSGMFPAYAFQCQNWHQRDDCGLRIMHFGYATPEDREEKYARYSRLAANGHANSHIESILKTPKLRKWTGPEPRIWRGYV